MKKAFIILIILVVVLSLRFFFFYSNRPLYQDKQQVRFEVLLLTNPQVSGNYQRITTRLSTGERIFITTSRFPQYSYGQKIIISGSFNKRLINGKYTIATMFFPKIESVKDASIESGLAVTSFVRQHTSSLFNRVLPQTSSSLLLGIVFGIQENIPEKLKKDLQVSGVYHVVAASGMNVTMVGGFLSALFATLFKRQIALLLTIFGLLFYCLLTGFDPPIARASIMGIAAFCAQILGRQTLASYSLFLAGYTMLFVTPPLLFDVGFQLSFASTLGLLYIRPLFLQKEAFIKSDVATTISAQIAGLPILLATFGTYSLWSIGLNALVLFTIPMLMILGGLGAISGLVFGPLGSIFLLFSLPLLLYFEKVVSISQKLGGSVAISNLPWQITFGYYLVLFAFLLLLNKRRVVK